MPGKTYDLAIIGGGVNGCGIARDALRYRRRQTASKPRHFTLLATKPAYPHLDNDGQGRIDDLCRLFSPTGFANPMMASPELQTPGF